MKLFRVILQFTQWFGNIFMGWKLATQRQKIKGLKNKIKAKEISDEVDRIDDDAIPSELSKWLHRDK